METKPDRWLFLRGFYREQSHWADFPKAFQKRFPQAVLSFVDLPGSGLVFDSKSPISISGILESVRSRYLKSAGSNEPFSILSISMGSMVAAEWVKRYPTEIQFVVMMNTSFANFSKINNRVNLARLTDLLKVAKISDPVAKELAILEITTNLLSAQAKSLYAQQFASATRNTPISLSTALRQLMALSRFRSLTDWPPFVKALLLAGGRDRLVCPVCSQDIAQHLSLPLEIHPNAGHDLPLDAPDWILDQIENFLS